MIVLGLDTCLSACSAALLRGDAVIASQSEPMARGHQERLAPMVRDLMRDAGVGFGDLDRVGVTIGPGSFTGLRVGLAFAKGLALALERPCVGVGTLEALACTGGASGLTAAIIDAGRGNLYLQIFQGRAAVSAPDIIGLDAATARLAEVAGGRDLTLVGPGAERLRDAVPGARMIVLEAPTPVVVARLAAAAGPAPAVPLYLRPPDATPKAIRVAL